MKSLLLLPLVVLVVVQSHESLRAGTSITECYSDVDLGGYYVYFDTYAPDLYAKGIDNEIESVYQTGMWVYYEDYDFNYETAGSVYYVHGINIAANFPTDYQNVMSSLRCVGTPTVLNANSITFYEGASFTGREYYTKFNSSSLGVLVAGNVSSFITTGNGSWTLYTGEGYTGSHWCVYNTDYDVGSNGEIFVLGIYPFVEDAGIPDNSIMSVREGCWASRVAKVPELKVDHRQKNGAWGRLV